MILLPTTYPMKPPPSARLIAGHPLGDPDGFWLMNERCGLKVFDVSGNGNTGTFAAGKEPTWAAGKFDMALDFDSTAQQYLNIPDNPILRPGTNNFSIGFWVDIHGGEVWGGVVSKGMFGSALANTWGFVCEGVVNKIYYQQATDGGGAFGCNISTSIMTDGWHHIFVRRFGNTVELYEDGAFRASDNTAGQNLSAADSITLGTTIAARTDNFDGRIDGLVYYNRALSTAEIQQLYYDPFCMFARRGWPVGFDTGGAPSQTVLDYERKTRGVGRGIVRGAA